MNKLYERILDEDVMFILNCVVLLNLVFKSHPEVLVVVSESRSTWWGYGVRSMSGS